MNNNFIFSEEIKKELHEIEDLVARLVDHLALLSQKIRYLISLIKLCKTINDAVPYFNLLDEIQLVLARLVFEKEIGVSTKLRIFITDFDNLETNKEDIFKKIKSNQYIF